MGGARLVGIAALVVSAASFACQSDMFSCSSNEACAGLEGGVCEAIGLCSVPSPECDSGRAYAEFSGSVSGECVPAGGETSTTSGDASTSGAVGSSGVEPALTTAVGDESSSSSGPGALSDSGTSATTTGGGSDADSGTAAIPPCGAAMPFYLNDFANGEVVPREWNVNSFGQSEVSFEDGALTISTQGDGAGSDVWWMVSRFPLPEAGAVVVEVVETPPVGSGGSIWLELPSPAITLSFAVRESEMRTSIKAGDGPYVEQAAGPYDAAVDRWLRMNYDPASSSVLAETSPDGLSWSTFHAYDTTDFEFDNFDVDVGGGTFGGSSYAGVVASVNQVAVCED